MRKIFALLCMLLPMSLMAAGMTPNQQLERAVQSGGTNGIRNAIEQGATNVDDVFMVELRRRGKISDAARILMEYTTVTVPASMIDNLYSNAIKDICANGVAASDELVGLDEIANIAPWDYAGAGAGTLRGLADFTAQNDENTDVALCVFDVVGKYKLAGVEFIDVMQSAVDFLGAPNIQNVINQLRDAIEQQSNK